MFQIVPNTFMTQIVLLATCMLMTAPLSLAGPGDEEQAPTLVYVADTYHGAGAAHWMSVPNGPDGPGNYNGAGTVTATIYDCGTNTPQWCGIVSYQGVFGSAVCDFDDSGRGTGPVAAGAMMWLDSSEDCDVFVSGCWLGGQAPPHRLNAGWGTPGGPGLQVESVGLCSWILAAL